jgi:AraC-like DNA-binding protein
MGVSIKSYYVWAKMRKAATLLQSSKTLTEIAAEVGFSDAAHLSRAYKRFFGISPSFLTDPEKVRFCCCET